MCIRAIQLNVNVTFYRHSPETRSSSKLIVKMPNLHSKHKRSPNATKRINRAVSVANRKIAFLKKEKQELLRKNWSLKKSVLRRAKAQSCQTTPHKSTEMSMLTPRRKSRQQLGEAGLAPRTVPVLRKRLPNAMVEEVKLSKNTERRKKSITWIHWQLSQGRLLRNIGWRIGCVVNSVCLDNVLYQCKWNT